MGVGVLACGVVHDVDRGPVCDERCVCRREAERMSVCVCMYVERDNE